MSGPLQTLLLCAEDDDLELVELVHKGRLAGLELEVVPGVEFEDGPLITALRNAPQALFVLLRSDNLSQERARELKSTFERHKSPSQHLLAVRLDPQRTESTVHTIRRRVAQLDGNDVDGDNLSTGRQPVFTDDLNPLDPGRTPIFELSPEDSGMASELEVTVPQLPSRPRADESGIAAPESDSYSELPAVRNRRRPLILGLVSAVAVTGGALGLTLDWNTDTPAKSVAEGSEPASNSTSVEAADAPAKPRADRSPEPTPADEDEPKQDEDAEPEAPDTAESEEDPPLDEEQERPRTNRRARRHRG